MPRLPQAFPQDAPRGRREMRMAQLEQDEKEMLIEELLALKLTEVSSSLQYFRLAVDMSAAGAAANAYVVFCRCQNGVL